MESEFATFEIAKTLKEFGFNEKCFGCYYIIPESEEGRLMFHDCGFEIDTKIKAPTWAQIKRWLWEKHKMIITFSGGSIFRYCIWTELDLTHSDATHFNSPIEAEIAGINKAVECLIGK